MAIVAAACFTGSAAQAQTQPSQAAANKPAPPVIIVLLPSDKRVSDDLAEALVGLKDSLRSDPRLQILTFSPDAPSFIVAARGAGLDLKHLSSDQQRQTLAQALDANLWVRVGADRKDSSLIDIDVFDGPSGRMLNGSNPAVSASDAGAVTVAQAATLVAADARQYEHAPAQPANAVPLPPAVSTVPPPAPPTPPLPVVIPPPPAVSAPVEAPAPVPAAPTPATLPATTIPPVQAPAPQATPPVAQPPAIPEPHAPAPPVQPTPPVVIVKPSPLPTVSPVPPKPVSINPTPAAPVTPSVTASSAPAVQTPAAPLVIAPPAPQPAAVPIPTASRTPPAPVAIDMPPVSQPLVAAPAPITVTPAPSASAVQPAAPIGYAPAAPAEPPTDLPELANHPKPPTPLDAATLALIDQGDAAIARGNDSRAIDNYRQAVDESPLNAAPRVRLAQAYLAAGDSDMALSELQRAVAIEPQSAELKTYLQQAQQQHLLPGIDVLVLKVNAATDPTNQQTELALGDAYWNSKNLVLAEQTYQQAARAAQSPADSAIPYARLARLYAATQRYSECLSALSHSGSIGYPATLRIVQQQSDNLLGSIDTAVDQFKNGSSSRTQLYDQLRSLDAQASAYAAFLGKVTPPSAYKISYLHRKLAANLMAQMTPNLLNYALTAQQSYLSQSQSLEHDALAELSQANSIDQLQTDDKSAANPT